MYIELRLGGDKDLGVPSTQMVAEVGASWSLWNEGNRDQGTN